MKRLIKYFSELIFCSLLLVSCNTIDNERIPNMAVNISLSDVALWNTYGVSGFGSNRNFIYSPSGVSVPVGFPYKYGSATGFGGVLLIVGMDIGMDPFSTLTAVPLAYDLACPVERKPDIRVKIDPDTYVAYCSQCKSTYDVTMQRGAPLSGEAATGKYKYALKSYNCYPSGSGGYYITN